LVSCRVSKNTVCAPAAVSAARSSAAWLRRGRREGGVGPADFQQAIQIDLRGDACADRGDVPFGFGGFVYRHQAQVALDQRQFGVFLHRAEHRDIGVMLDHGAQLGFVAAPAEAVEDHAGDADVAVEGLVAEDQRGDAARHAARIEHQDHRQVEQAGQRRIAVRAVEVESVVEALVAFDQADFGVMAVAGELGLQFAVGREEKVEVVAGAPGGDREPQRIDVVGPFLEGLHGACRLAVLAGTQRRRESDADGGLARGLVRGRDQEAMHGGGW
jgi:hypothetical protein